MTLLSEILGRRLRLIAPRTTDIVHERDLPVMMDDGVVLLADRWVAGAPGGVPQPTVLVRSPYGRRGFAGLLFGRLLAERGLSVVVQSVRGTFGSGGVFTPFDERADGLATLRWLAGQPWHSGRVATIGPSYLGLTQWALAPDAGEALAGMAIQVSASQFFDQTYPGGAVALETIASWLTIIALQEQRLAPLAIHRAMRSLAVLMGEEPLVGLDARVTGAPVGWLREGFASPGRDGDYWAGRDFSARVGEVRAPVSVVGGWQDILLPWMLDDVLALQAAGRPPRVTIGPWTHTSPALMAAGHREGIAFLRAVLLDDRRLLEAEGRSAPVRLWLTGAGEGWREFAAWPPPSRPRRLVLAAGGRLGDRVQDGVEEYVYDPADPTPALGGPVLLTREPVLDNAPLEARDDVLVYTGEPLAETLEVIGRPSVEVWVRGEPGCFDVFARLCEVDGAGVSRNRCDALVAVDPERWPAGADGWTRVAFELWPIGHRFAAGHRLRLLLASGAHPRYARNPGTGEDRAAAAPGSMRPVTVRVLHDAEHPSAITLPVRRDDGDAGDAAG